MSPNPRHLSPLRGLRAGSLAMTAAGALLVLAACTPPGPEPTKPSAAAAVLTEVDVPGTTAMSAAAVDLGEFGYTETEYYAEGEAHRYRGAITGALETAERIDEDATPYRTRVLVRTPDAADFNGTLVVEWTNVTLGLDADFTFSETHAQMLREGYAYAVVSVQTVGVERLTTWNPERYEGLTVQADNVDPVGGEKIEPCFMGAPQCPGDTLSWDVMTQVAQALENNSGDDAPLAGLTIENVIATGQSQSAARLTTYYNTIQPIFGLFDGFVFWDRAGDLRTDLEVPGISVNSESLAAQAGAPSSTHTRIWDVAGSSHGSLYAAEYMDTMMLRDESTTTPAGPLSFTAMVEPTCEVLPPFSTVPAGLVVAGAIDAVRTWIVTGEEAAPSVYFGRDAAGALARDANGQVEGGLRLAEFAAPTAVVTANNGASFPCGISGSHRFLTDEELTARYVTHENYVERVRGATDAVADGGYVMAADAKATIEAAESSSVAK